MGTAPSPPADVTRTGARNALVIQRVWSSLLKAWDEARGEALWGASRRRPGHSPFRVRVWTGRSLLVLWRSSPGPAWRSRPGSFCTSQSATLVSAETTSTGVGSLPGGRRWRRENLVTWSLIFTLPGLQSSNSMVKEAWLCTTGDAPPPPSATSLVGASGAGASGGRGAGDSFVGISK